MLNPKPKINIVEFKVYMSFKLRIELGVGHFDPSLVAWRLNTMFLSFSSKKYLQLNKKIMKNKTTI